jgi:hypothetical protein
MVDIIEFETLIKQPESHILDFKSNMYDFQNDKDLLQTAKFVKDIISLSNTIRERNAYIIFGIEEKVDGSKELKGLDVRIDDNILQSKISSKVYPIPKFQFYTINYKEQDFGVIEIPVVKYPTPIMPTLKMKGLEAGTVYYRQGTSNSIARYTETMSIQKWLDSLTNNPNSISNRIQEFTSLIKRLNSRDEKLSVIISDILNFSREYNIQNLKDYSIREIKGIETKEIRNNDQAFFHRTLDVKISPNDIETNPYLTADMLKREMTKENDFYDYKMLFHHSLTKIEDYLNGFEDKKYLMGKLGTSAKKIFPNITNDYKMNIFFFEENIKKLYESIRNKTIKILVEIE